MSDPFIGQINMFAGNFAPTGWALCNGQLLSIQQNAALFSILGTTYGGNGTTTFGLPNLQSRFPMHAGQGAGLSSYVLGEMVGNETTTLTTTNLPSHTHSLNVATSVSNQATATALTPNASNAWLSTSDRRDGYFFNGTPAGTTTLNPGTISPAGSTQAFSNMPPGLVVNFIIALVGIFPSRN
ncbi:MAG: phage tail protein [Curvibacter sp.]|nr:phage tail protein [Curvibacter sp.]